MDDGNYEVRWNVMSWGHGTFGAHEVGGLLWTYEVFWPISIVKKTMICNSVRNNKPKNNIGQLD
jgi:hypothetical protein